MRNRPLIILLWLLSVLAFSFNPAPVGAAPPLPGAIFTTNSFGSQVNGNLFQDKCDVYLDGGPGPNAPAGAAGLPDGDYYFQVTDPSGQVLLSTDPVVNRQIRVQGGFIVGVSGAGNHASNPDNDYGNLGARVIRLCPYLDTPNNGGVYKVWITPVANFLGNPNLVDNGYSPGYFHGFLPAASKTDNFKVKHRKPLPCLTINKFFDRNGNGIQEVNVQGGEGGTYTEALLNWPVTVLDPNGAQIGGLLFTPTTLCNLTPGTYVVTEEPTDNPQFTYDVTATIVDGQALPPSRTVAIVIDKADRSVLFGNNCTNGTPH